MKNISRRKFVNNLGMGVATAAAIATLPSFLTIPFVKNKNPGQVVPPRCPLGKEGEKQDAQKSPPLHGNTCNSYGCVAE